MQRHKSDTTNEVLMAAEIAVDKAKATMIIARDALNLQIEKMVDHQIALRKAWTTETTLNFSVDAEIFEAEILDCISPQRGGNLVVTPPHAVRDIVLKAIKRAYERGVLTKS